MIEQQVQMKSRAQSGFRQEARLDSVTCGSSRVREDGSL